MQEECAGYRAHIEKLQEQIQRMCQEREELAHTVTERSISEQAGPTGVSEREQKLLLELERYTT